MEKESYFDGGLLQQIGWSILGAIITACTLGICYPWAKCMLINWEAEHTVIEGKRLRLMVMPLNYLEIGSNGFYLPLLP